MHQNSLEAFGFVKPHTETIRMKVLETLIRHHPLSTEDIAACLHKFPSDITWRIKELRDMRLIEECGTGYNKNGLRVTVFRPVREVLA